ncbi:hypothetical protein FB478_10899 [Arthrobacter sp. AG367]|uniref:hypothetical protein n=1 Tax=Arthrobacter sp. AG367 TaxID=2572909 RepID=UPI0011A34420|nr:hypothetical protein [Arthrobacter sp. AG367]TWD48761.1 hypothetical protein FB478_10899 [Arthrobacter sp. AG367]
MTSASDNLIALVDDMLQDAGAAQDAELRDTLVALGALASLPVPAPTGELAALLAADGPAEDAASGKLEGEQRVEQPDGEQWVDDPPGDELARRRRRHRPTALGLVLVAGMGLGVGGVAASSSAPGDSPIEHVLTEWMPWNHTTDAASAVSSTDGGPDVGAEGEVTQSGATAAPAGAADASHRASRFLLDPAGLFGRTRTPACGGPVKHDAGTGPGNCAAEPGAAAVGGAVGGMDGSGRAVPAGTPADPAAAGPGKAGAPAPATVAGGVDPAGTAQKAAGSAATSGRVPGQGQPQNPGTQEPGTQGAEGSESQGTGPKAATQLK